MRGAIGALLVCFLTGLPMIGWAQSPIPPAAKPAATRADPTPPASTAGEAAHGEPAADDAEPEYDFAPFTLRTVEITGSSLPSSSLAAVYGPYIGRSLDPEALRGLSDKVAQAHADAGLALYNVVVPDQNLSSGRLRLEVLEGFVEAAEVKPPAPRKMGLVRAIVARLKAERPLRQKTLERQVSLIRDIQGLNPELDFKAGERAEGVILTIDPAARTLQAGFAATNRGAALLGRTQLEADLFGYSLLRQGDQTRLAFATATDVDRFQYYVLGHSQPIGADGLALQLNLSHLRTKPKGLPLQGEATGAGVQLSYPVIRGFTKNLSVSLGLDGLDSDNAFLGLTFSSDRVRATRATAAYTLSRDKDFVSLSAVVSQGVDGLGARTLDPRAADLGFRKIQASAGYNRAISERWVVRTNLTGQWTNDVLPASEFFSLGGAELGRRFETASAAGDRGYGASIEIAYTPKAFAEGRLKGSELYGFLDGGEVQTVARPFAPARSEQLASAGAGVRFVVASKALLELEAARSLGDPPHGQEDGWRATFTLKTVL